MLLGFVVVPLPSLPYATHMAGFAPVWISHGTAPFLGRCYPLGGASCWSGTDGPAQLSWVASSHRQAISQSVAVGACVCVTSCLGILVGCLYYTCLCRPLYFVFALHVLCVLPRLLTVVGLHDSYLYPSAPSTHTWGVAYVAPSVYCMTVFAPHSRKCIIPPM